MLSLQAPHISTTEMAVLGDLGQQDLLEMRGSRSIVLLVLQD